MVIAIGIVILLASVWLRVRGPDIPLSELHARYSGADSEYIELPGDIRLHHQVAGPADAPSVVLVHGYGDSFTSWAGWVPVLARRFRVYVIDLPGHGLTAAPADFQLSTKALVQVVRDFATYRGLTRFALVGNSMGGGVAWLYGLENPQQITALILVDAAGWPLPPPSKLPFAFRLLQYRIGRWLLSRIDNSPLIADGLKQNFSDSSLVTEQMVVRWAAFQRAPGHRRILMSASPHSFALADPSRLSEIRAPTLILHGEQDSLIPVADGYRFSECIPEAEITVYKHVGHLPQLEIPEKSAGDALMFLEKVIADLRI